MLERTGGLLKGSLLALFSLIIFTSLASAEVVSGIPPGVNEVNWKACGQSGFINFENLSDEQVLGEELPGVKFTTTDGQDWIVGRFSTDNYNGKYPDGAFTCEGDAFAWLGPDQGIGVIRFTEGKAGYFSCLVSTSSGVVLDAYDASGNLLVSSGRSTNNFGTGTMDRLIVSRPQRDIQYVTIHDSGDAWLLDSICTDAPGVVSRQFSAGRMTGVGVGVDGPTRIAVSSRITATNQAASGPLVINVSVVGQRQPTRIVVGTAFSAAVFQNGVANLKGTCTVNGVPGGSYEVIATGGRQGTMKVLVHDAKGALVCDYNGPIVSGGFQISPIQVAKPYPGRNRR